MLFEVNQLLKCRHSLEKRCRNLRQLNFVTSTLGNCQKQTDFSSFKTLNYHNLGNLANCSTSRTRWKLCEVKVNICLMKKEPAILTVSTMLQRVRIIVNFRFCSLTYFRAFPVLCFQSFLFHFSYYLFRPKRVFVVEREKIYHANVSEQKHDWRKNWASNLQIFVDVIAL